MKTMKFHVKCMQYNLYENFAHFQDFGNPEGLTKSEDFGMYQTVTKTNNKTHQTLLTTRISGFANLMGRQGANKSTLTIDSHYDQ